MSAELEAEYARLAIEHARCIDENSPENANAVFNDLTRVRGAVRKLADGGHAVLLRLSEHGAAEVRVHAATDLVLSEPARAKTVLEEIARGPACASRIMANATLYALDHGAFQTVLKRMTDEAAT